VASAATRALHLIAPDAKGVTALLKRIRSACLARADLVTLGVQGVIIDQTSRVLLVRHGYRPGWHFPGGGVEPGENIEDALAREMLEETGVIVSGAPRLFGIYSNFEAYPGDHIVLFVIDHWRRERIPKPNAEIIEQSFFARDELPHSLTPGAGRRLNELFDKADQASIW
jgi:ADP-ribose pyrophosphatase YjhB (NUDIX family)